MTYRALDWVFDVEIESELSLSVEVGLVLEPLVTPEPAHARYSIERRGEEAILRMGDERPFASREKAAVLQELVSRITDRAAIETGTAVAVHAGCVAAGTAGIVLAGRSGSGKSTLVSELVRQGFSYLTDELTAIDVRSGVIRPFPKPLTVKAGSWDLMPWPRPPLTGNPHIARLLSPDDLSARWHPEENVRPRLFVFPTFDPGSPGAQLTDISRGDAAALLLNQCLPWGLSPQNGFESLIASVSNADCYRLRFSTASLAVDTLRSALARRPS